MKHIKIFENFVLESGYAEKIKDLGQRAVDMANKKAALSAKVKELTANAEKPKDVVRAEIGRLQLQILELDRQKLQLSKRLADLNQKLKNLA
jgi:chromosome segregation ATPase